MAPERKNPALKARMKSRWSDHEKRMQAEIELRNAKAMQREYFQRVQFLNNTPQKQQVYMQQMQVELMEVEDVT